MAKRILTIIREPTVVDNKELVITASIGIATLSERGNDYLSLRRQAAIAKDHSENNGGDCFRFASKTINGIYERRHKLESGLRRAIDKNELILYFQPQVDIKRGGINGLEALLRWQNDEFGNVSPAEFIPLAEETKLILPIGEWVLTEACRTLVALSKHGITDMNLSVNLSAIQIDDPRLTDMVRKI